MFNTQKQFPVVKPEPGFVSIPRGQSVYCEDCDTVSVRKPTGCGVCGSYATLPLSRLVESTNRGVAAALSDQVGQLVDEVADPREKFLAQLDSGQCGAIKAVYFHLESL